jgi:hypothetical protein
MLSPMLSPVPNSVLKTTAKPAFVWLPKPPAGFRLRFPCAARPASAASAPASTEAATFCISVFLSCLVRSPPVLAATCGCSRRRRPSFFRLPDFSCLPELPCLCVLPLPLPLAAVIAQSTIFVPSAVALGAVLHLARSLPA